MKTVKTIVAYIEIPPEGSVMPFRWDVPAKEEIVKIVNLTPFKR